MTFTETLTKLYKETEHTQIYALPGYDSNGKPRIGFRRSCADSPYREDPIIDDTVFMLYADAFDFNYNVRINNISDLWFTNISDIVIDLYAQSYTFPITTINLGTFKVKAMDSDYNGNNVLTKVHLEISRIH